MEDDRLDRKVSRRIIPLMMILSLFAFLDRVNIGFAARTMNQDLGFTPYIWSFHILRVLLGVAVWALGLIAASALALLPSRALHLASARRNPA